MGDGQAVKKPVDRSNETYMDREKRKKASAPERAKARAKISEKISHTGIFAVINQQGAQNVVLVHKKLTPAQLEEISRKTHAISTASVTEKKATKKAPTTEGEVARR